MAPLVSDPRQIVINFNPARRQALLKLVDEITNFMLSELDYSNQDLGAVSTGTPQSSTPSQSGTSTPQPQENKPKPVDQQAPPQPDPKASKEAVRIQKAALKHMTEWKKEFMPKLEEIVNVEDGPKIQAERKKHVEEMEKHKLDNPEEGEDLMSFGDVKVDKSEDFFSLQLLYHPIPTRLTSVPVRDRKEALSCILLLLLSTGKYSAHSRTLALYLASALELPQTFIIHEETEIAKQLMSSSKDDKEKEDTMSAETEAAKRRQENKFGRFWKVGLASVAGAAVIGVTGGLAAPLVAGALGGVLGGIGLGGVASFLGIFWMNGALVGALFGAYGAKMTGEMMDNYAKEVEDFKFIPLREEWGRDYSSPESQQEQQSRRLRLTIGINGWLNEEEDITSPWRVLSTETEVFALRYEMKTLVALGTAFTDLVKSAAWNTFKSEVIKRTVFATLWAALWPIQMLAAASNVDNPFSRGLNRSRKAGHLLADALINKVQGERPVTLIGYSLGAAAIHACLQSLAERRAFGLVDTVVIIGAPAPAAPSHWRTIRTAVSGKIYNVFSENDMILGFVYRAYSLSYGVAGLQSIKDVSGIENLDLSEMVSGHLRYPELTGEILRKCAFVGVKGSKEIEKDDVIRMKDDYKEGKLVDYDEKDDGNEAKKNEQVSPSKGMTEDLKGLNLTSEEKLSLPPRPSETEEPTQPAPVTQSEKQQQTLAPSDGNEKEEQKLNLPPRPDEIDDVPSSKQEQQQQPQIKRKEVPQPSQKITDNPRPLTPTSNADDDEEYKGISMVNKGSP